jgi:uncharacterized ParB-like nuclease family protein
MFPNISVLTLTVIAAAALTMRRFVTTVGAVPAAGAACVGVTRSSAAAAGDLVPVDVLGTAIVETGGAIAVGAAIECDASGRAITRASGVTLARMAPGQAAATGAGQFVEVVLIPN